MRLLALLALVACDHQYIAIRDAEVIDGTPQYAYDQLWVGDITPTYAVTAGGLDLSAEGSVTVEVSFAGTYEFTVTELVFLTFDNGYSDIGDHWVYTLDDDEKAAQKATITLELLTERPTKEWCTPKRAGTWTCFAKVDDGLDGLGLAAAGGDSVGLYLDFPVSVDAMDSDGGGGVCDGYTIEDCCGGSAGVSAVECAWDPACDCPEGTTDIGTYGDGNRRCDCPG